MTLFYRQNMEAIIEIKGHYQIETSSFFCFIFEHDAFQTVFFPSDVSAIVVFTPTRPSRSLGKEHSVWLVVLIRPVLNLLVPTCSTFLLAAAELLDNDS